MAVAALSPVKILSDLGYEMVDIESDKDYLSALMEAVNSLIITNPSDNRIPILQEEIKRVRADRKAAAPSPAMKKVSVNKLMGRKAESVQKIQPQKLLSAASEEDGEKNQPLNTNSLAERLNNIVQALGVLFKLKKQELNADKRAAKQDLRNQSQEQKAAREQELEKKKKKEASTSKSKAFPKPFTNFFDTIKTFFGNILAGSILLKMLKWLKDPQNEEKINKFTGFLKDNALAIAGIIAFIAALPLISTLLSFTSLLISGIALLAPALGWIFSPLGLAALALAVGIGGTLLGMKAAVNLGRNVATGGQSFTDAHDALDKRLFDAGMNRSGGNVSGMSERQRGRSGGGRRGGRTPEQEKIWQEVVKGRERLNALRDAMREEQKTAVQNLTPDKTIKGQRQRGKGGVRGPDRQVVSKELKDKTRQEIRVKYESMIGSSPSTKIESSSGSTEALVEGGKEVPGVSQSKVENLKTQAVNLQKTVIPTQIDQPLHGGEGEINFLDLSTSGDSGESGSGTQSGNQGAYFSSNRGRIGNRVILGVLN